MSLGREYIKQIHGSTVPGNGMHYYCCHRKPYEILHKAARHLTFEKVRHWNVFHAIKDLCIVKDVKKNNTNILIQ